MSFHRPLSGFSGLGLSSQHVDLQAHDVRRPRFEELILEPLNASGTYRPLSHSSLKGSLDALTRNNSFWGWMGFFPSNPDNQVSLVRPQS